MRTCVIGARGQLGSVLVATWPDPATMTGLTREELDITRPQEIVRQLDRLQPEVVINASAYNLVDQAEDEPAVAYAVNALGPRNLALACAERNLQLVHISSDYVFGLDASRQTPYTEEDAPGPTGAYAVSKLAGEYYVRTLCPRSYVLRTCGLYGGVTRGSKGNFVDKMLDLGRQRSELNIVDDQWCTPTSVRDLARAIIALVPTARYGLYHATNSGATTWCQLAREIFRVANLAVRVNPIPSSAYPTKARRPAYSVLNCEKLAGVVGFPLRRWQEALADVCGGGG